ncbi:hypothetical protein KNE206_15340 [Kitasatospora sp. NE20-6]|uniref:DUF998 domain-containing protein n=1 Tax=Kitasatospora sp. NE20-6 TaxID=2859066 RepID=UPI0034DBA9EB
MTHRDSGTDPHLQNSQLQNSHLPGPQLPEPQARDHRDRDHRDQDPRTVQRLRFGIGIIGFLLPIVLLVGNSLTSARFVLLASMSASYYTHMRNIFVGSLCAIGVFLICYRHDRREDRLSTLAGVFAVLTALFPTLPPASVVPHPSHVQTTMGVLHLCFAAGLFGVLAFFCLRLFGDGRGLPGARIRGTVYLVCGWVVVGCIVMIAVAEVLHFAWDFPLTLTYLGETVAVFAFGVAWLVKSEAIVAVPSAASPGPAPA